MSHDCDVQHHRQAIPDSGNVLVSTGDNKRARECRWSMEARTLVRSNLNATGRDFSALITRLMEQSGNPRWACRRFARRMGLRSKRVQRPWTTAEQQRLLKLLDLHPVPEIARLMRRSHSSIWHMLYRLGANAKMGKDSFTKYTLAVALAVRPEKVQEWITRDWLKTQKIQAGPGVREIIAAEDFCQFCKDHTRDVVGNRLRKERLDFVYHFVFPPSHAELLPVRESKRERAAFEAHTEEEDDYAVEKSDSEPRGEIDELPDSNVQAGVRPPSPGA